MIESAGWKTNVAHPDSRVPPDDYGARFQPFLGKQPKSNGATGTQPDRFWISGPEGPERNLFGDETTVGIVDEQEGGIIAYIHEANAPRLIEALRAFTG
ncbi:MAG: hypothetical protein ACOH1Y_14880 [Propionicimonas sp.]